MGRSIVIILPGTPGTSRNIARHLRDLDVEVKIIPVVDVKIHHEEVKSACKVFSSGFTPDISIFTSKTAVKIVKRLIPEAWRYAEKYSIAIGPGTASLIRKLGGMKVEYPREHSSEGLVKYLINLPNLIKPAVYCSSEVNTLLEQFLRKHFNEFCLWKLYSLFEKAVSMKKIIELVRTRFEKTYVIVITSLKILKIISREAELLARHENLFFSLISKRLVEEASRLGLRIDHSSSTNNITEYYVELKKYIKDLLQNSK